jgi:GAF domain-containing protein
MTAFHADYPACLAAHVRHPGEATLEAAYALGRDAVAQGISVMEVAAAHHDALSRLLADDGGSPPHDLAQTAGDVFLEVLAAFDMQQRGFLEVRDSARRERRRSELVQQLTHYLADTSLTLPESEALTEVLHLVAEQARELTHADASVVTLGALPQAHPIAASAPEGDTGWEAFIRWLDLTDADAAVRDGAGAPVRPPARRPEVGAWLGVALTALTGRVLGCLHLMAAEPGAFTPIDEAVALQLAQMSAGTIERAEIHAR